MKGKNPTKKEKEHMDRIVEEGCCVCRQLGYGYSPAEVHHLDGKTKEGAHLKTIPLCPVHHRTGQYGIALHQGKAEWVKRYGSEESFLEGN